MSSKNNNISFESAQELYNDYNILDTTSIFTEKLKYHTTHDILNKFPELSPREIYNELVKFYPNENVIKANFVNSNLLKSNSHVSIFELNVNNSRADICKINGHSFAYEIKTDLDSTFRLEKQLQDYLNVFEYVFVICSNDKYDYFVKHISEPCGVYTYTIDSHNNIKFKLKKSAIKNNDFFSEKQLNMLTLDELVTNFITTSKQIKNDIISEIQSNYTKRTINSRFKKILKLRFDKRWNFIIENHDKILDIDYQWFFKNNISPSNIYVY
ncbi:sce7726 family protein [Enterococcus gallinarum]|uniref:sce7726 family protein n=1 Tax=Enterococcus gallinarum TaxID=1353 RepID=UPI001D17AF3F|nr:sce7726 family protein [Enterococcus gallinarum]MCC4044733.1 sce7726 family protein [Enterococcus gallinarum]